MWLLQVTLVVMVNNILSINHPKLETQWNSCSVSSFGVLYCMCTVSLYLPVTSRPYPGWLNLLFFNLFLWKEWTFPSLPSPFLSSVSISPSLSLYYTPLSYIPRLQLFCSTWMFKGLCMCLESGMVTAFWKGTSVWWWWCVSFAVAIFTLFVFNGVFTELLSCMQGFYLLVILVVGDQSILQSSVTVFP